MQCGRAWRALHQLQAGRRRMHRSGFQTPKVRSPSLPYRIYFTLIARTGSVSANRYVFISTRSCLGCNLCIVGERRTDPHCRVVHRKFWDKFDNTQASSSSQIHAEIRDAAEAVRSDGIKLATNTDFALGGVPESQSPLSSSCLSHDSERDHEQHVPHLICELNLVRLDHHRS